VLFFLIKYLLPKKKKKNLGAFVCIFLLWDIRVAEMVEEAVGDYTILCKIQQILNGPSLGFTYDGSFRKSWEEWLAGGMCLGALM
jgi:hypothetical protein